MSWSVLPTTAPLHNILFGIFIHLGLILKLSPVDIGQHLLWLTKSEGCALCSLATSPLPLSSLCLSSPHSLASSRMIFPWVWVCMQSNGAAPMRSYCSISGRRYSLGHQYKAQLGEKLSALAWSVKTDTLNVTYALYPRRQHITWGFWQNCTMLVIWGCFDVLCMCFSCFGCFSILGGTKCHL